MERFVTLSRQDPQFGPYLDGTFSARHRALPIRSMNVNTGQEKVTFEIVPLEKIARPHWALVWVLTMRPHTAVFSLGPMLAVLAWLFTSAELRSEVDGLVAGSAFLGILLFHISMNLFNDYYDHIRGQDRINPRGGSRAIQKGWLSARRVQHAAILFMSLAIVFGLPVLFAHFNLVAGIAVLALIAGLEFSSNRLGLKYRGFGELTAFLLTGPLLTAGFTWAVTGQLNPVAAALGLPFGLLTAIYYHLANFEDIMVNSQTQMPTLSSRLGFEGSKKLFCVLGFLAAGSIAVFAAISELWGLALVVLLIHLGFLVPLMLRVLRAPSCLSSDLAGIRRGGWALHLQTVLAFAALFLYEALRG